MSAPGTYQNPSTRDCWVTCKACMRCAQRGKYAKCVGCSGRHDPFGITDPHPDDTCTCTEGVLRFVTAEGKRTIVRYKSNPFAGTVTNTAKTQDERDWDSYLTSVREKMENPYFDPIIIDDGKAALNPRMGSEFKHLGNKRTD